MDNILVASVHQRDITTSSSRTDKKPQNTFSSVLTGALDKSVSQDKLAKPEGQEILVGSITHETPTISDLLLQNKKLGNSTWDIIFSDENRNKDYTKIKPGTLVYLNQKSGALNWSGDASNTLSEKFHNNALPIHPVSHTEPRQIQPESTSKNDLVSLGRIDSNNPTVSHLLKNNEDFKQQMWDLLGNDINKDKPYHRILANTEIMLDPKTNEIVWSNEPVLASVDKSMGAKVVGLHDLERVKEDEGGKLATNLSEAVQVFKGVSYDKINCYELLVKGLDNMNIAYSGKNGLYSQLTNMAAEKGLAENAYLNGEGIVKAAGSTIVSKNYSRITDWRDNAGSLLEEIEPLLGRGQILSFSTQNRGHTGIVGRNGNQWTFINSGRLDNSIDAGSIDKGVGEEVLSEEISNWFRSAQEKGEALSVTLGQLDKGKIQTASTMPHSFNGTI